MSPDASTPTTIDQFFNRFKDTLIQTWKETGFGHVEIDSERIKHDKIQVILRGSTHYRYVISDKDVEQWASKWRTHFVGWLTDNSFRHRLKELIEFLLSKIFSDSHRGFSTIISGEIRLMFLPILAFSAVFVLLVAEILFPKAEEKKTPEQELKDAITKYVSQAVKTPQD